MTGIDSLFGRIQNREKQFKRRKRDENLHEKENLKVSNTERREQGTGLREQGREPTHLFLFPVP